MSMRLSGLRRVLGAGLMVAWLFALGGVSLSQKASGFVGSKNSNKYHYASCRWAQRINPANKVEFKSVKEAQQKDYIPCKVCKPPAAD